LKTHFDICDISSRCAEGMNLPVIIALNKIDLLESQKFPNDVEKQQNHIQFITNELREYIWYLFVILD